MNGITVMQLADAIKAASEEVPWVPDGPRNDEYWRQIAFRTQGNLRKQGAASPFPDRARMLAALGRIRSQEERLA